MKPRNRAQLISFFWIAAASMTALQTQADIIGVTGGTAAPPPMVGPFNMTPFKADGRPVFQDVNSVDSPLGGDVTFSTPLSHLRVGGGWASWSHGYGGDVYWTDGGLSASVALPPETTAFYF